MNRSYAQASVSHIIPTVSEQNRSSEPSVVDNKFLPKLSQNLLEILNDDDEYYDITIEVGNDPYVKIFHAHMIILNYRTPYLRRILSTNKKKNDGTLVQIKLPNISPEIFQIILRYIYGGRLPLEEYSASDIINILKAAGELSLQELIPYLQIFLIENKANWMEQNFNLIYQTSFEYGSFLELQKYCTDLISNEPEKIFNSLDFISIPEKSLISLIQNDNLQISEIQVWEHVLKWGLAQNPELSSDPTNYSKDDFNALKNTLQQCIPFIRFYNLTSNEFLDKMLPFKKILPKELYKDLLKYFLDSDNKQNNKQNNKSKPRVAKEHVETPEIEENLNNAAIERALEMGNYEDAFAAVLASHDLPLILRLCKKVNPKSVFPPSRTLFSQPVILSIIHHLSLELNKFSELKRAWIGEAVIKLNPKDHIIREHCKGLLPIVKQRLVDHYYQVASQDAQSPSLKNIGLLIHSMIGLLID